MGKMGCTQWPINKINTSLVDIRQKRKYGAVDLIRFFIIEGMRSTFDNCKSGSINMPHQLLFTERWRSRRGNNNQVTFTLSITESRRGKGEGTFR
jgi:hypothetical protein